MEYMDKGSLDGVYKKFGPIPIDVVALIALSVLEGLTYLYDEHRIIHRGGMLFPTALYVAQRVCRHQTLQHPAQL